MLYRPPSETSRCRCASRPTRRPSSASRARTSTAASPEGEHENTSEAIFVRGAFTRAVTSRNRSPILRGVWRGQGRWRPFVIWHMAWLRPPASSKFVHERCLAALDWDDRCPPTRASILASFVFCMGGIINICAIRLAGHDSSIYYTTLGRASHD